MSIINKMHQDLKEERANSPILSVMPEKKYKKKVMLIVLIFLLLLSSIGLSFLIYQKKNHNNPINDLVNNTIPPISAPQTAVLSSKEDQVFANPVSGDKGTVISDKKTEITNVTVVPEIKPSVVKVASKITEESAKIVAINTQNAIKSIAEKPNKVSELSKNPAVNVTQSASTKSTIVKQTVAKPVKQKEVKIKVKVAKEQSDKSTDSFLQVTTSTLSKDQLADIHLKKAEQALSKGDTLLATQEKNQALNLKPELHKVRTSLALYYYSIGELDRATTVLKKGVLQFPEYADFSLMLSRIALKNGDEQKAYLYLNQHPPKVEGNLDYHVNYALLAHKFKQYEQSESLYRGLLKQRPDNGRWRMLLAIARDKQGKRGLAIKSYQKALLQRDLSSKAKEYINQRLTYLQ